MFNKEFEKAEQESLVVATNESLVFCGSDTIDGTSCFRTTMYFCYVEWITSV